MITSYQGQPLMFFVSTQYRHFDKKVYNIGVADQLQKG